MPNAEMQTDADKMHAELTHAQFFVIGTTVVVGWLGSVLFNIT